jgi:hypothetical protein
LAAYQRVQATKHTLGLININRTKLKASFAYKMLGLYNPTYYFDFLINGYKIYAKLLLELTLGNNKPFGEVWILQQ